MIQINIQFLQQPVDDDFISFDLVGSFFNDTVSFTFKDVVADATTEVQIGASLSDTINNTLTFLNTNFFFPYLVRGEWVRNGGEINTFIIDDNPTVDNIIDVPEFVIVNSQLLRTFIKPIFCRSPFWVVVDLPLQLNAKVEVFIWNEGQTEPTVPTYTVSKEIPATNRRKLSFDVSPYIREFIEFERQTTPSAPAVVDPYEYCKVRIKAFSDLDQILNEPYYSFYGYGDFMQGWNPDNGRFSQMQGRYLYDRLNIPTFVYFQDFNAETDNGFRVQYRDLNNGNPINIDLLLVTNVKIWEIPLSTSSVNYDNGNFVAIQEDVSGVWIDRYVIEMIPQCEPKYTPLKCDFVNKWGAWQSITFFKRSDETFNVKGTKYQLMPSSEDYNVYKGEMQSFNVNGKVSIKVNTGWVDESYREVIRELMLSETILIENKKVVLKSESTELFKNVNTKVINYEMEFDFAFSQINKIS